MAKGGKMQALADAVNELERELVKIKTQLEIKESTVADDAKRVEGANNSVAETKEALAAKTAASEQDTAAYAELKQAYDAGAEELARTEELLQTLLTGLSSSKDDEGAGGYMGALAEAKARLAAAGTEAEQAKVKIGLAEREIKDKEPRAKKAEKEGEGLVKELATKRAEVEELRARVNACGWDEDKERSLLERQAEHSQKIAHLSEKRDTIKSRLASLDFDYSDPYPNFDRNKVKGLVATLVDLDEANYACSTALEICAGGRLYNVVVEDEKTGAALLDKGKLRKRVTLIPLNKINAFRMSAQTIATAEKVAPGKVNLALDLVGCDEEVSAAMAYVFGNVFVCKDKESAKAVTFNKSIGVKSVTLEGDVYDPSGTLSGGAAPSGSGVLVKVQELRSIEKQIAAHKKELDAASRELASAKKVIDQWRKDKRTVDLRAHEVTLLEEQVNSSNATKVSSVFPVTS
jgi:structural maintenance of chromosome 2